MTSAIRSVAFRRFATPGLASGLLMLILAVAIVLGLGLIGPYPALFRGWLLGFAIWSCLPVGSMALLLIHRLSGGRWGTAASAVLGPAAAMMPLVLIAFVPVLTALSQIYPWAADPARFPHDVTRFYLATGWFVLRALITLTGWSVLGLVFAVGFGSRLLAGLGLAFFGLTTSLVAVDWYLSLEPHYVASAFAATIAVQQMLAALALTAALSPPELQGKAIGDIGGLMIAMLLGVVYLEYMTFVVAWYGDLPQKAEWFLKRSSPLWQGVLIAGLIVGAMLPFAMLLVQSVRTSRSGVRIAGLLILVGTALHFTWLLAPAFDKPGPVVVVAAAALALLTLMSLLSVRGAPPIRVMRHAD